MSDPTEVLKLAKKTATEVVDQLTSEDISEAEFLEGVIGFAEVFETTAQILRMLVKYDDKPKTVH